MSVHSIRTVGVIGSGIMGQGIAQITAQSGFDVLIYDLEETVVKRSVTAIAASLAGLVLKGKITSVKADEANSRIVVKSALEDVKADLIIEAVTERLEVKQQIFTTLEAANVPATILASNTSSLSINAIARNLKLKNRFAGLHFFNPAPVMKLVEIVSGAETDSDTVTALRNFCDSLGKTSVHVQDSPGFIVNRVARLYYVEALKLAEEGVADFETIDKLMRAAGFKMGPFELMDLIGIDTNHAVTTSLYEAFYHEARFRPSRIQQQKVDSGDLGRKSGKGFYDYTGN